MKGTDIHTADPNVRAGCAANNTFCFCCVILVFLDFYVHYLSPSFSTTYKRNMAYHLSWILSGFLLKEAARIFGYRSMFEQFKNIVTVQHRVVGFFI